jgi:hypothetical protein
MSTPSEQPFDPNDLTAYAPKWARRVNDEARRRTAPAANDDRPIVAFHDAVDALRDVHLRERDEDEPPHDVDVGERGGFYIDNFRVPPSLDPTRSLDPIPVANPYARRQSRGRVSSSVILVGKFMVAASVAALAAFLLVGKFPSQGTAGAEPPSFKQIASLGPTAPVIPEAAVRAPEPVAATPIVERAARTVTLPPSKVQERPRSVPEPASTSAARLQIAALPPQPAEPVFQPGPRLQLAAQPSASQTKPEPSALPAETGKGNRIVPTVETPSQFPAPAEATLRGAAPPVAEKAAPPPRDPQPPAPKLAPDEIAVLLKRSEEFIGAGDFASARIVLRRAAESGHAGAALALAGTYDPAVLERFGVTGMAADPAQAKFWYEKAREMGSGEAPHLLERLASQQN